MKIYFKKDRLIAMPKAWVAFYDDERYTYGTKQDFHLDSVESIPHDLRKKLKDKGFKLNKLAWTYYVLPKNKADEAYFTLLVSQGIEI
jgi:hypothetical protein